MTSKAQKLLKMNLVLFLVAVAVSMYLVWHHYTLVNGQGGFGSFCSLNETIDCDTVNASKYSEILGIPLATFALSYYVFAAIVCLIGILNQYSIRESLVTLFPFSGISFLASIATFSITAFILGKWCLMCLSLQILNTASFGVTVLAVKNLIQNSSFAREFGEANKKKLFSYLGGGLALFGAVYGLSSQLREEQSFDEQAYVNEFRSQVVHDIDPGDSPRQGFKGENPPVRLIEFADFQCPACGFAAKQMHRLVRLYEDKIQLVFKNFPLDAACNPNMTRSLHPVACVAAKAGFCAGKQGKFVPMYEKLYGNQQQISRENITLWAKEIGLNLEQLDTCIASKEADTAIRNDVNLAIKNDLNSTPTFFVNGRRVQGAIDEARLKLLLRELGQ